MTTNPASSRTQSFETTPFCYLFPVWCKYRLLQIPFLPTSFFPLRTALLKLKEFKGNIFSKFLGLKTPSASKTYNSDKHEYCRFYCKDGYEIVASVCVWKRKHAEETFMAHIKCFGMLLIGRIKTFFSFCYSRARFTSSLWNYLWEGWATPAHFTVYLCSHKLEKCYH